MTREARGTYAEALPTRGWYVGGVTRETPAFMRRVIKTCTHRHKSQETAQRCADRLLLRERSGE